MTATAGGEVLHSDRINLDKAAAREKFAETIGQPANDLFDLRDALMEHLTGPAEPDQTEEQPDPTIEAAACDLLDGPDILDQAAGIMSALGYQAPAGAEHLPKLVYLTLTSRLLARPLNLVVTGPSSAGKSFLVSTVCRLVPATAFYALSGMSERVLAYTDADLRHKTLIIGEAAALHRDGVGASLLRAIAWEGRLVYETVEKTANGLKPRRIEKPGPTGFITTTTGTIEAELATRVLELSIPDTMEATRIILNATAAKANGHSPAEPDLTSGRSRNAGSNVRASTR